MAQIKLILQPYKRKIRAILLGFVVYSELFRAKIKVGLISARDLQN